MNTNTATINMTQRAHEPINPTLSNIWKDSLLHWLLICVRAFLEYAFGMHIGAAVGYTCGLHVGSLYVEFFKPAHLSGFDEIRQWLGLPYVFAVYGVIFGVVAGSAAIAIINDKLLHRRVIALYEQGVTDPEPMARTLIKPKFQIQKAIIKLTDKNIIYSNKEYMAQRMEQEYFGNYVCANE